MDEDVDVAVGSFLAGHHDVKYSVAAVGSGATDPVIRQYLRVQAPEWRILVTADNEFAARCSQEGSRLPCLWLRGIGPIELDRVTALMDVFACAPIWSVDNSRQRSERSRVGLLAVGTLFVVLAACSPGSLATPSRTFSAQDLADSLRFRRTFGLRTDEAWIVTVAMNASSAAGLREYGVPLTAEETRDLDSRAANSAEISPTIEKYARDHQDEWAGLFIDQQATGAVVALFTGHVDDHRAAIGKLVNPKARWEVRPVRWTLEQLSAFAVRVDADQGWLKTIGAGYRGSGVLVTANVVQLRISSADPKTAALVVEHFAAHDWLEVESDGLAPWTGGSGVLVIHARDRNGKPVAGLDCVPIPDDPNAYNSDTGWSTSDTGTCRIPDVGATTYRVELRRLVGTEWVAVGTGRVTVPRGGVGIVDIDVRS